ncbi:MAG: hypothetical protein N2491_09925 [Negativicutes bacterium]|nr:hypothetical protein [Negativicutes bacterium]
MKRLSAVMVFLFTMVALSGYALAWPGHLEGKPDAFRPGDTRGYFIWHDDNGMHLRTTTRGHERIFTGVIRTDGKFVNVDDFKMEGNDRIRVSRDRDTIWFRLSTAGAVDGLNFRIKGGDYVHFELYMDGHRIDRKEIFLGDRGWHPRSSSFTIHR